MHATHGHPNRWNSPASTTGVVLGADGIASISRRGRPRSAAEWKPGLFNTVIAAVGQVDWASVGTDEADGQAPGRHDHRGSAGGGLARLEDRRSSRW